MHVYVLRVKLLVMHAYSKGTTASHACVYKWGKKQVVHAYTKGKTASHGCMYKWVKQLVMLQTALGTVQ